VIGAFAFASLYLGLQWFSFHRIIGEGPDMYWDTDPYARMYRVGSILNGHDWIVQFQNVDGYPIGHESHWTLPFDAWCVALAKLTSLPTAGLLASPLVGLFCMLCFAFWCFMRLPRPIACGASLIYLLQPSFHWATALGRPDHQSLTHACFLVAVILDLGFWLKEFGESGDTLSRWRVVLNAVALGVGLWTTIEMAPLWGVQIFSALVIAVVMRKRGGWRALGKRALGWLLTLAILVVAYGVEFSFDRDHVRIGQFASGVARRWFGVVQEFQPLMVVRGEWRWYGLHGLFGTSFYLLPFLAWFFARSRAFGTPFKIALASMVAVYTAMAFAQIHWVSNVSVLWPLFATIAIHAAIESRLTLHAPRSTVFAIVLAVLFLPCVFGFFDFAQREELGLRLRPVCEWLRQKTPPNRDMEHFSMITPRDREYSVMTQWWQGSYVQYLARRPVVATPYHTNMDAILDSYRFYVATSWAEAERILERHRCRYVLVEDNRNFVEDAQRVLQDGREWMEFGRRKAPDGAMRRTFKFTPLFYETMFYRLQVLNGGGLPFRLVYESRERSPIDPTQARFKLFEFIRNGE
jgi:asparagine N-glycosylation enzyme membrane subunit Stt3